MPLSLVCFRHAAGDAFNLSLMERLNASGEIFLTHTKLGGKVALRLAVCGTYTERRHVERAWQLIRETAAELSAP